MYGYLFLGHVAEREVVFSGTSSYWPRSTATPGGIVDVEGCHDRVGSRLAASPLLDEKYVGLLSASSPREQPQCAQRRHEQHNA